VYQRGIQKGKPEKNGGYQKLGVEVNGEREDIGQQVQNYN
jgi:hypothetical protein